MIASDPIRALHHLLRAGGRPHMDRPLSRAMTLLKHLFLDGPLGVEFTEPIGHGTAVETRGDATT
jgi:hypothetical protein